MYYVCSDLYIWSWDDLYSGGSFGVSSYFNKFYKSPKNVEQDFAY